MPSFCHKAWQQGWRFYNPVWTSYLRLAIMVHPLSRHKKPIYILTSPYMYRKTQISTGNQVPQISNCPIFQENESKDNLKWIKIYSPFGSLQLTVFTRNYMSCRLRLLFDCGVESTPKLWDSGLVNDCYCWGNWQCDRAEGRIRWLGPRLHFTASSSEI